MSDDRPFEPTETKDEEDVEKLVDEMFSRVQEFAEEVTAGRVALATTLLLMIIGGIFAGWYWVIPRDSVDVETVYFQRGGHVVMSLVNNDGSRAITDVEVDIRFIDSSGVIIDSMGVNIAEIPSHSSISGDDLEMHIQGYTVWAEYTIGGAKSNMNCGNIKLEIGFLRNSMMRAILRYGHFEVCSANPRH